MSEETTSNPSTCYLSGGPQNGIRHVFEPLPILLVDEQDGGYYQRTGDLTEDGAFVFEYRASLQSRTERATISRNQPYRIRLFGGPRDGERGLISEFPDVIAMALPGEKVATLFYTPTGQTTSDGTHVFAFAHSTSPGTVEREPTFRVVPFQPYSGRIRRALRCLGRLLRRR